MEYNNSSDVIDFVEIDQKTSIQRQPIQSNFWIFQRQAFSIENRHNVIYSQIRCDSFYNIPSSLGKAPASGIGKGSKTQMVNSSALKLTPSPQNYHVKSDF